MTKAELVEEVANQSELTKKDAEVIVQTVLDSITESLQRGEKIELRGFGSFRIRNRSSRQGRNPKTGQPIMIAARNSPSFRGGKGLKTRVADIPPAPAPKPVRERWEY